MTRSIGVIVAAILLTQPKMAPNRARAYAKVVREEARSHHFDPYTLVAMVHFESRWRASATNGRCMGLAGICLSTYRACQQNVLSGACSRRKQQILDGRQNLRIAADLITANRKFCRRKTGRARFHHWLASYQGANRPSEGIWCGQRKVKGRWRDVPMHRLTRRVIERRRWLIRKLGG